MTLPKKVDQRLTQAFFRYRPILQQAKDRDVNEADTVAIVKGILADGFGWDPYFEVTSEFAIRNTFVDLAVKANNQISYLIEVKSIGSDLKDHHLRQALGYAANQGVEWTILTNGAIWQAHRVIFGKPMAHELVFQLDLLHDNFKDTRWKETAFLLTKEGMTRSAITQFHAEKQAMSKYNVAAIIRSESVLAIVRRELRRVYPKFNPSTDEIHDLIINEVFKRDVVDGDKAGDAVKSIKKLNKPLRVRRPSSVQPAKQESEDPIDA
jgi:hypothetical protein